MTTRARNAALGLAVLAASLGARAAQGQCIPPANSDEAKLLAFYEAPLVFATADAPMLLSLGHVALTGEIVGIPTPPSKILQTNYCYAAKQEATHLAPILPRLRVTVGLPLGFALEGSYLPPITVDHARPSLGSGALSYTRVLLDPPVGSGPVLTLQLRAHGTVGSVHGPITCAKSSLQQTDPSQPCYGTKPSDDIFYPYSAGGEAALGVRTLPSRRLSLYAGTGYTWIGPQFQVGFTDLTGFTDHTQVEVRLSRVPVFGGASLAIIDRFDVGAQVYSVPADLTTWRLTARYRL